MGRMPLAAIPRPAKALQMRLQRIVTVLGGGKPLARITLDMRGKLNRVDHNLRGKEEEALVFIEAEEHLRRAHGLAVASAADGVRSWLPRVASGMPPEVFATMVASTVEQLGDKLPDDVVIDIGEWRGGGN